MRVSEPGAPLIVVAGDALIDLIVQPDRRLLAVPGGGQYNTARAIGRLGVACAFLGALSRDRFGRELERSLAGDGVDVSLVRHTTRPTTLALAELDESGSASYGFWVDGTSAPDLAPADLPPLPPPTVAVHVGTLGLVLAPLTSAVEALVAGLPDDVLVMLDPNCRPVLIPDADAYRARVGALLPRADVVKASTDDLRYLFPLLEPLDAAHDITATGVRVVLVTDGPRPVTVLIDGRSFEVAVPVVPVVDTVGAGDAFGGAFLACLVQAGVRRIEVGDAGAVSRAASFAAAAAAVTCTRPGADAPTLVDLGGWPRS